MVFVQYGQIDVWDGVFVVIDQIGVCMYILVGLVVCIMFEFGIWVFYVVVYLVLIVGILLVWVGEVGGVEFFSVLFELVLLVIFNLEGIGDFGYRM